MLIHYLVKDEPQASRFQSGLFNIAGRPKLAALAFPLPIAQAGRSGGKLVLWGQVRPARAASRPTGSRCAAAARGASAAGPPDERAWLLQHRGGGAAVRACASTRRRIDAYSATIRAR